MSRGAGASTRSGPTGLGSLWTVILAAGSSSRLGRPKQLVRLRGRTLLARTVGLAEAVTPGRVIVVVGADRLRQLRHLRRLPYGVRSVVNARWRDGMAGSLAAGVAALPGQAALVLLVDQPLIDRLDVTRLIERWRGRPTRAAASVCAGRAGVPAILPRRLFARVRALRGDTGARAVLRAEPGLVTVAMPHAAVDVDTRSDVERLA